jgi:predicted 2-oxoglutarate/Fe(II)-dependent dioxygenase YbiX
VDQPFFDLYRVKNFLKEEVCRELIDEMRNSAASPALTYGKGDADRRLTAPDHDRPAGAIDDSVRRVKRVHTSPQSVELIRRWLEEQRESIAGHFVVNLTGFEEPQFLRYSVGDFFVAHQDGNTGLVNLESDRTRRVSVTIFLNNQREGQDSDTYGGGSLVFSDWRTGVRQEVPGEAGMLVAFRSELTHEVLPVTRGERYAIVSWCRQ